MARKRGKLSLEEEEFIQLHVGSMPIKQIAMQINRTEETVLNYCMKHKLTYVGMSEEMFDDTILRKKLEQKPYWDEVKMQFSDEELHYFCVTWVRIIKQFREDILYTEELQVKQWITLEILSNRVMKERKRAIEQLDRMQTLLDQEYAKGPDERDNARIAGLETEIAMVRNSLGSYTTEHSKILDKIKDIQRDLKAARSDRVKKVEDSKTSWVGFIRALEDEQLRAKVGEEMEIMRMAKDKARKEFSKFHTYEDGQIDQPLLTTETAKE